MKINLSSNQQSNTGRTIASACLASCQKLIAEIQRAKDAIREEFSEAVRGQERLLRLALNEAESLAWQTGYPHLVFAELATEKAEAVAAWNARQRSILDGQHRLAMAA